MNKQIKFIGSVICLVILVFFITSCSESPLATAPVEDPVPNMVMNQGLTADQINLISWSPEVVEYIKNQALVKRGMASKFIKADKGGNVGGERTFGNEVKIPPNAMENDTWITVEVLCIEEGGQCGAGVDFLPSTQFLKDVEITLSWAYLDLGDGNLNFQVYYSEDDGVTWYPVGDDVEINYDNQTITFEVDHFTRFSWGF